MADVPMQKALADMICKYLNAGMDPRDIMRGLMDAENKLADLIVKGEQ